MADTAEKAEKNIRQITECSICMNGFNDPKVLPCIHTFCLECIKRTVEAAEKKPGDKMPCPLCRKEFTIPREGIVGLQRNFFMENLIQNRPILELRTTMQSNESILKSEIQKTDKIIRIADVKSCLKHTQKPLDYYCADCKKIVCVACFVESHASHKCKDVTTVDKEFRYMIEKKSWKISTFMNDLLLMKDNKKKSKTAFLKEIVEKERAISDRSLVLKDMLERHTKLLLDELSEIKSKHLKEIEIQVAEIDRCCTILSSFEAYCNELALKGSASDICSSVDQLIDRAEDLEKEHEAFIGRPHKSVEVNFIAADLSDVLRMLNYNLVGNTKASTEAKTQIENCAIVVGLNDGWPITNDVIKLKLRSNEISTQEQIPTAMGYGTFAAVYSNTMYVTGIGSNDDEIWRYSQMSGWKKCASLVQGRRGHSAAFIDEVLYICGGIVVSNGNILDSVEAYNAITGKCATVGKLVHCVDSSGNCVPYISSLYIFGGLDNESKTLNSVQVYNTKQNICTLLTKPMPRGYCLMRAVLWDTSVILVGRYTSLVYNIETETWKKRKQFKTDVDNFGLVLDNGRIFAIGGCWRSDVRYIPLQNIIVDKSIEWKIHAKLPRLSSVSAYAMMRLSVL